MFWLQDMLGTDMMYHIVIAAIVVAVSYFFSRAVRALLGFIGRRILTRTETMLDDRILSVVLSHVRPLMVVVGLHLAMGEIRKGVSGTDLTVNQILEYGESLLYIVVVVLVVKILLGILKEIIHWYLEKMSTEGAASLRLTLGPMTDKAVSILLGMVAIIILLDHFGINIGSLLVSLGVGSLAVALAAQDTLANMIAGFVILVDRPFRVGDRVQLASGEIGDVQQIGLRSTRILNYDANVLIVPNAELVKGRLINYSHPSSQTRILLKVGVAYGSDTARVRTIILDLAHRHPEVLKQPEPLVLLTDLGESSIEFTLVARVGDYSRDGVVKSELLEQMYLALDRAGIEIPFPQRVVHMKTNS